jgi:hypothetical protein
MALLDSAREEEDRSKTTFPECARGCACVEYFGVSECEAICPHKFNLKTGDAKKVLDPRD